MPWLFSCCCLVSTTPAALARSFSPRANFVCDGGRSRRTSCAGHVGSPLPSTRDGSGDGFRLLCFFLFLDEKEEDDDDDRKNDERKEEEGGNVLGDGIDEDDDNEDDEEDEGNGDEGEEAPLERFGGLRLLLLSIISILLQQSSTQSSHLNQ